jgi:hypothetical protein
VGSQLMKAAEYLDYSNEVGRRALAHTLK